MGLFDSHAHLDDPRYNDDREAMLSRAREAGVEHILNVGYDLPSSRRSVALAEAHDFIYAAVGIHPHDAKDVTPETWEEIRRLAAHPKVVALGEMGLDFYRDNSPRDVQREVFRHQLQLARELDLPVVIHDRDAHGEVMEILKKEGAGVRGVLHCFSGSWEMAKYCMNLGFNISLAGPVTFQNARNLHEVARKTPLDRLMIETDAPYLCPAPHRGKRNESAYVAYVAEKIGELRGLSPEEVAEKTTENAKKLFGIG